MEMREKERLIGVLDILLEDYKGAIAKGYKHIKLTDLVLQIEKLKLDIKDK